VGRIAVKTTDDQRDRPRSSLAGCLAAALVLLLVVYLLLPGPAFWLYAHGYVKKREPFAVFFRPIGYFYDNYPTVSKTYNWYFTLLVGQPTNRPGVF
jgi:hypothetical protein